MGFNFCIGFCQRKKEEIKLSGRETGVSGDAFMQYLLALQTPMNSIWELGLRIGAMLLAYSMLYRCRELIPLIRPATHQKDDFPLIHTLN